jgi:1,4-dihydroxy-2-naphthoate octaprenyltransferase
MRTFKRHTPTLEPRTLHLSLFEALVGAHLEQVQHDAMVVLSVSLLFVACWLLV